MFAHGVDGAGEGVAVGEGGGGAAGLVGALLALPLAGLPVQPGVDGEAGALVGDGAVEFGGGVAGGDNGVDVVEVGFLAGEGAVWAVGGVGG